MTVYFFYGDEDFNIEQKIMEMKSKLNPDFLSMSFHIYDNPEYADLINILRTPPMMFGNMLTIIDAGKYFSSQKKYFEDSELADIEDALKNNPETLDIVFVVKLPRNEGKKVDSRKKLYKILSKFNTEQFAAFKTYQTAEISNWIKKDAKKKGITLQNDAVELLITQLGSDLRQIDTELDKLKLIAYPETVVTSKMVGEIAISTEDLFNLTDMIMKGKKDEALLEFRKIIDKKHPLEVLAAVQTMLRKWIIIKTKSQSHSSFELSKLTGQPEFVIKQTLQKLKNTPAAALVNLKKNLYEAECKIKSGESLDINSEVEIAIIR